jgi:hypothetical protein
MGNQKKSGQEEAGPTCALSPVALNDRQSKWRRLSDQALSRTIRPGSISSRFPPQALETLQVLIAAEAECCPFLSFDVRDRGEVIDVVLQFPVEFGPMVSSMIGGSGIRAN